MNEKIKQIKAKFEKKIKALEKKLDVKKKLIDLAAEFEEKNIDPENCNYLDVLDDNYSSDSKSESQKDDDNLSQSDDGDPIVQKKVDNANPNVQKTDNQIRVYYHDNNHPEENQKPNTHIPSSQLKSGYEIYNNYNNTNQTHMPQNNYSDSNNISMNVISGAGRESNTNSNSGSSNTNQQKGKLSGISNTNYTNISSHTNNTSNENQKNFFGNHIEQKLNYNYKDKYSNNPNTHSIVTEDSEIPGGSNINSEAISTTTNNNVSNKNRQKSPKQLTSFGQKLKLDELTKSYKLMAPNTSGTGGNTNNLQNNLINQNTNINQYNNGQNVNNNLPKISKSQTNIVSYLSENAQSNYNSGRDSNRGDSNRGDSNRGDNNRGDSNRGDSNRESNRVRNNYEIQNNDKEYSNGTDVYGKNNSKKMFSDFGKDQKHGNEANKVQHNGHTEVPNSNNNLIQQQQQYYNHQHYNLSNNPNTSEKESNSVQNSVYQQLTKNNNTYSTTSALTNVSNNKASQKRFSTGNQKGLSSRESNKRDDKSNRFINVGDNVMSPYTNKLNYNFTNSTSTGKNTSVGRKKDTALEKRTNDKSNVAYGFNKTNQNSKKEPQNRIPTSSNKNPFQKKNNNGTTISTHCANPEATNSTIERNGSGGQKKVTNFSSNFNKNRTSPNYSSNRNK